MVLLLQPPPVVPTIAVVIAPWSVAPINVPIVSNTILYKVAESRSDGMLDKCTCGADGTSKHGAAWQTIHVSRVNTDNLVCLNIDLYSGVDTYKMKAARMGVRQFSVCARCRCRVGFVLGVRAVIAEYGT